MICRAYLLVIIQPQVGSARKPVGATAFNRRAGAVSGVGQAIFALALEIQPCCIALPGRQVFLIRRFAGCPQHRRRTCFWLSNTVDGLLEKAGGLTHLHAQFGAVDLRTLIEQIHIAFRFDFIGRLPIREAVAIQDGFPPAQLDIAVGNNFRICLAGYLIGSDECRQRLIRQGGMRYQALGAFQHRPGQQPGFGICRIGWRQDRRLGHLWRLPGLRQST